MPSQINNRMKKQMGKNLPNKRANQLRGTSAKSYDRKSGITGGPKHLRNQFSMSNSMQRQNKGPLALGDYAQMSGPNSSRHQSFDQTGNSYAK